MPPHLVRRQLPTSAALCTTGQERFQVGNDALLNGKPLPSPPRPAQGYETSVERLTLIVSQLSDKSLRVTPV